MGTQNMTEEGSKQPHHVTSSFSNPTSLQIPSPGTPLPTAAERPAGRFPKAGLILKEAHPCAPQFLPSGDSETRPKNTASQSKASVCAKSTGLHPIRGHLYPPPPQSVKLVGPPGLGGGGAGGTECHAGKARAPRSRER